MRYYCALAAALIVSAPAAAQIQGQSREDVEPETPGTNFSWGVSFNPAFGNDLDVSDDRITNENTVSATAGVRHNFSFRTYVRGQIGVEASPSFASHIDIPGAALVGELRIGQRILLGSGGDAEGNRDSIDLHGTYEVREGFEEDEDDRRNFSDRQFGVEATFQNILWLYSRGLETRQNWTSGPAIEFTAGWATVESNLADREKNVLSATAGVRTPPSGRLPSFSFEGSFERSRYELPVGGLRRRDDTVSLFGGVSLNSLFAGLPHLEDASVGVRVSQNFSTIEDEDDKSIQLQFTLGFGGTQ